MTSVWSLGNVIVLVYNHFNKMFDAVEEKDDKSMLSVFASSSSLGFHNTLRDTNTKR